MLLTFSENKFEDLIKNGSKIHTFREDIHNRWKVGMLIHFWMGNPRNVQRHPYQFGYGRVKRILPAKIDVCRGRIEVKNYGIDKRSPKRFIETVAQNDGFESWEAMKLFFEKDFTGRLIFWEDFQSL